MLRGAYVGHVAQGRAHRGMGRNADAGAQMHAIGQLTAAMAHAMDARCRGAGGRRRALLCLGFSADRPDPHFSSFAVALKRTSAAFHGALMKLGRPIPRAMRNNIENDSRLR